MQQSHAVVIGGSFAGLCAARVLADHFDRVTIIERDQLPSEPVFRAGVPQARHAHTLLSSGRRTLEQLFPGITQDLLAQGAVQTDFARDYSVYNHGTPMPMADSRGKLASVAMSRELIEHVLRQHVLRSSKISVMQGWQAVGLEGDASRITGVRLRSRTPEADETVYAATLVIDASGRSSQAAAWLSALGCPVPEETVINSHSGYATRRYRMPDGQRPIAMKGKRNAAIYPIEHGECLVTLAGSGGDYPPTDEAGFLAYAQNLATPTLYNAIKDATPSSPIYGYRSMENRLRHYHNLKHHPAGFVALGDAVCTFNPLYGQGMTMSAEAARLLDRCLRQQKPDQNLAGLAPTFYKRLHALLLLPWMMAICEDLREPTTVGGKATLVIRMLNAYTDQVLALAAKHPSIYVAFFSVVHMVTPGVRLLAPDISFRVLGRLLRGRVKKTQVLHEEHV